MIYDKLNYYEFGRLLIETGDLDPVYIMLNNSSLSFGEKMEWILAYSCFYHSGIASWVVDRCKTVDYFEALSQAYQNFTQRGRERRHFRGALGRKAIQDLAVRYYSVLVCFSYWFKESDFQSVERRIKECYGFGDWIAFKIADMMERVLHFPVDFSNCYLDIYKEPVEGAWLINDHMGWNFSRITDVFDSLVDRFKIFDAPPGLDRKCNIQEIETICCKVKSHMKGHYPVGHDIDEVRRSLIGFGNLAEQLSMCLPKGVING